MLYGVCSYTQSEGISHSDYPQYHMLLITLGIHCKVYTSGSKEFFYSSSLSLSLSLLLSLPLIAFPPSPPLYLFSPSPSLPPKISNHSVQISIVKERFFYLYVQCLGPFKEACILSHPFVLFKNKYPEAHRGRRGGR